MSGEGAPHDAGSLAARIDHTILRPDATTTDVAVFCDEARTHRFRAVCVNPIHVAFVADRLAGSDVRTCSVVAFPFGATAPAAKAFEAASAIAAGADEIDMVIAIGPLKARQLDDVRNDLRAVRDATAEKVLKVIIETSLLTDEEKIIACRIARDVRADFVKTSTGYGGGGATLEDVRLMRSEVGPEMGVKASGGIRTREAAEAMIEAGATRIGTSSGLAIIGAAERQAGTY